MSSSTMTRKEPKHVLQSDFPYRSFDDLPIYDQRYMPRWETSDRAYYRIGENQSIVTTELKNLNLTGACLYVNSDVLLGQSLQLRVLLSGVHSLVVKATVMWKRGHGAETIAGVYFDRLDEPTQDLVLEHAFQVFEGAF